MLITFTCRAHENITLFGDVALRLIRMMGHSGAVPSAILAKDVPNALDSLQQVLDHEKRVVSNKPQFTDDGEEPLVSLSHRAFPLIGLLRAAVDAKCDVLWR